MVEIQSAIRGFLVRRQYQINHLADHQLENYRAFVVGNDPKMPAALDRFHESKDKIALIGTSGMRAVSLACKLGNATKIPKIIIVDNSKQVQAFWLAMRDFASDDTRARTKELFENNINQFLSDHGPLIRPIPDNAFENESNGVKYLHQGNKKYFSLLFEKYGYDYVRRVIMHTSLIKQSWADKDTFVKLKNILAHLNINKIYLYPSNIVACIDDQAEQNDILNNIQLMSPVLAIHTDRCAVHKLPERVLLTVDQAPSKVLQTLFSHGILQPAQKTSDQYVSYNVLNSDDLDQLLRMYVAGNSDIRSQHGVRF